MTSTIRHSLRVSKKLDERIRAAADFKKWKLNTLMTEALKRYVDEIEEDRQQQHDHQQTTGDNL